MMTLYKHGDLFLSDSEKIMGVTCQMYHMFNGKNIAEWLNWGNLRTNHVLWFFPKE